MLSESDKNKFLEIIENAKRIVFFGGAGVSTESGIPDFRSQDGLYNQKYKYPPEEILSHTFFMRNPEGFYEFYRDKILCTGDIKPNRTHQALAKLEEQGKLSAVVTQNIDCLHHMAGSKKIYELHGTITRNYCMKCHRMHDEKYMRNYPEIIPRCECGGIMKPDVVLYEEGLDDATVNGALFEISNADVLIIGGTSLVVHPAAGMVRYFKGDKLVLINKSATYMDSNADLVIRENIGDVFGLLL